MSLLARFQAGSKLDSHGQFTLDESKAREKMARFQLVTTEEFLMLVVQAAVAATCSSLSITLEGNEVRVVAHDAALDSESLRSLRPFLFDSQPENVAYNLLAVAANAVEPSCVTPPLVAMVDDDLHFEANLNHRLGDLSAMLQTRLRYFPHPLSLNGTTLKTEPLLGGPRLKVLQEGPSSVTLVRYGVVVGSKTLMLPIEFEAVAPADNLSLDASFSQVVEDDHYAKLMKSLDQLANRTLAEMVDSYEPGSLLENFFLAHYQAQHRDPAGKALRRCPFFPYADRPGRTSFEQISKLISSEGKVMVSTRAYNLQLDTPVILLEDARLSRALRLSLPPNNFEDAGAAYMAKAAAERNKARWESSPRPTELPPGRYLAQELLQGLTWEAAVGFLAHPGGPRQLIVLYQGKLLASEPFDDVPPGTTAVLNVRQAEVHPSWTRLDGREYRNLLKELRDGILSLFNRQSFQDPAALFPELERYLLNLLSKSYPPKVATLAPLFPSTGDGPPLTFAQIENLESVSFGDRVFFGPEIPVDELIGPPLLLYSPERFLALTNAVGPGRARDVRELQKWLLGIQSQMKAPRKPELDGQDYLVKAAFDTEAFHGEIGLLNTLNTKVEIILMKDGVVFERCSLIGGRVLSAQAVVEAPTLTLNEQWNGFVRDAQFNQLHATVRARIFELESSLIDGSINQGLKLKLLRAHPQEKGRYWDLQLFETTTYGKYVSLAQLQHEINTYGCLLRAETGIALPDRVVLRTPGKEVNSYLAEQLSAFHWQDATGLLRQYQQAREFEARPVYQDIALPPGFPITLPVPEGRGQLGLHPNRAQGEVQCYVTGRLVCVKTGIIPTPFMAAVESETFTLSDDFQDVTVPKPYREMLQDLCAQVMLKAAVHADPELRDLAWTFFQKSSGQRAAEFGDLVTFPRLGAEPVTLTAIAAGKVRGWVQPSFTTKLNPSGLILRLWDSEAQRLSSFLRRTLINIESQLEAEEELQQRLGALPVELPKGLYQREFEDSGFRAVIGVSMTRLTVGLGEDGRPVGKLRDMVFPVQAIVSGAHPNPRKGDDLRADLPGKRYSLLERWSEQLCLDWIKEKADDGELIRHLLVLTMREIGHEDDRPTCQMAALLWDMPLFNRVDGSRVSGSALALTLSETEQPIVVSDKTFRVPGSAILLTEGSDERTILVGVFGKSQLQWYEAPPLFDSSEMRASVKRLVSWGFSPISRSVAAVGKLFEKKKDEAPAEIDEKRDPRETLVVQLKEDVANLLGRDHFKRSNALFRALDFGSWPLGPPIYRRPDGAFRLNGLHSGIRWLLAEGGDERQKRAARMLLVVHWVGLVNVASEELRDPDEDAFLGRMAERMAQTFASSGE